MFISRKKLRAMEKRIADLENSNSQPIVVNSYEFGRVDFYGLVKVLPKYIKETIQKYGQSQK